ncbi:FKBP-type peptidyl-prolyl cis-trans isomerase [bacterium]|nr:FKBP-type peptidyl-prolyl cis-trans isomerase [candidate division CSSED10-310 bacterium]
MKRLPLFIVFALLTVTLGCNPPPQEQAAPEKPMTLDTEKDKISYSLGADMGKNFKMQNIDIDVDVFARGLEDAINDREMLMSDTDIQKTRMDYYRKMREDRQQRSMALSKENKEKGEAFLAENKKKEGVVTTETGLQYKIITEGSGERPKLTDKVKCHYRGTLIDGTEFDSSISRGEPATFPVNGVIPGWTEALQKMSPGAKWELYIPSELAYGERGAGPKIGPNETLIFEVELLEIL